VIAITMPIRTNTTIAICIQIQVGDTAPERSAGHPARGRATPDYSVRMAGRRLHVAAGSASAALALWLCGLLGLLAPAPAQGTPVSRQAGAPPLGGVNIAGLYAGSSIAVADRQIQAAHQLNATIVRAEVRWSALEPQRAGQIDARALAFLDRLVADAAQAGIRPILTVDSTPCWASSAPASLLRRCQAAMTTAANSWPPADPAAYAAIVGYLAQRYGSRLAAIEIWNEPDQSNQLYFAGPKKVERYATLLRAAYPAVKQAAPGLPVLGGSLVGSNGQFLRALYAAGIKGYYDGLAVHFYNLVLASVRAIHEVQVANGDSKPLWLDEFGWSSCFPARRIQQEQACVTARTQARNVSDSVRAIAQAPYVAAQLIYDLQSSRGEDFGVLSTSGAHKPAFGSLARALAAPFGAISRVTVGLRRHGAHVVASGSAPVGDYMQLEAFVGGVLRYRALFTLDRFDRYSIVLPSVLGTRGLRVRVFQYWAGVGRAAQRGI
jgi:polysaccharide biosynthesis protein PslG